MIRDFIIFDQTQHCLFYKAYGDNLINLYGVYYEFHRVLLLELYVYYTTYLTSKNPSEPNLPISLINFQDLLTFLNSIINEILLPSTYQEILHHSQQCLFFHALLMN
ncbi:unnamed protein product [Paramecium sonneborni]|uniref:Uncharacterized protein n=1 Tax=Paramecium sonneborni TaxID=65129 RepID=A0A8S1RQI0_9CILI|nr:unnamed protein product [Paramecium sonneborni]